MSAPVRRSVFERQRSPDRPVDPRARDVVHFERRGRAVRFWLNCGHIVDRRPMCRSSRVICRQCPAPSTGVIE
jgi:hypothetical protein